jgi:TonB-dependent starch-binding outer membrane protein SusC
MKFKVFLITILSVLFLAVASGQKPNKKFQLSGTVTNAEQQAVVGALIMIDGKNTGIVTDAQGMYRIKVRPDADSITVITFNNGIGTAAINGQTTINFLLGRPGTSQQKFRNGSSDNEQVNIGYGNVSRKDLSTPVSNIDATNSKYASYKNIYEILKGTPGVLVNGNSVKIQGQSSFNSGTEPLYVVDGMIVDNIEGIPPSMVENISVLKGASTSIYGSRGTNGVIIITLHKGNEKTK